MKKHSSSLSYCTALLLSCLFSSLFSSLAYSADNDWVMLLDGTSGLENFNLLGDANWSAQKDAIQATEGNSTSFLVSKESYDDFTLRIEFWTSEDANSGIFMRCQDSNKLSDKTCYEANIYDQRPDATYATGGIVHISAIGEPRPLAGGKWNVYLLTMQGTHLLVELNGKVTADVHDSQFSSGVIGLQWGRGMVRFRKVEIKRL